MEKPGVKKNWKQYDSDNDGLWTSMYGAGECFAYAATGNIQSKVRAKKAFDAMVFLGDVTQDGVVDVLDIVLLINIIMGQYAPSSLDLLLSDLNEDGTINVQDCILLINIILTN